MKKKIFLKWANAKKALFILLGITITIINNSFAESQNNGLSAVLQNISPVVSNTNTSIIENTGGSTNNQGFNVFKKDQQLELLVERYQKSAWAANAAKLSEKALMQEYVALDALQNYLSIQQQQKQQRVQALLSTYQALKTQEAFKKQLKQDPAKK
jgi:lipopolysaccharide export LptBFGC system permease protein LptF